MTIKKKYQWLLFDADGTLFDFARAEALALEQAFARTGALYDHRCLAVYQRINEQLWQALERGEITASELQTERFARLCEELELSAPARHFSDTYLDCLAERAELIDGALEVLDSLRGTHRFAILTNGLRVVQRRRLAGSAIRNYIEELIISEEVGCAKPAPAIFAAALNRLGNPNKAQVLMIGDSLTSDIRGGAAFGIDTCWYNPERRPQPAGIEPTHQIAQLTELIDLLAAN